MADMYQEMMLACRLIADSFPEPRFYRECDSELNESRRIFTEDPLVSRCLKIVSGDLEDNMGHGLDHVTKVAIEAGAMAIRERERICLTDVAEDRIGVLAHLAGLLHDLRRGERDHARTGSRAAATILDGFPLSSSEKTCIVEAIANHEAFVEPSTPDSDCGQILSNTLYDADKFRWGADNFTLTLWEMLRSRPVPMSTVIRRFPEGMDGIERIRSTFRSETGKIFGPEFIDLGLRIGERVYRYLKARFVGNVGS